MIRTNLLVAGAAGAFSLITGVAAAQNPAGPPASPPPAMANQTMPASAAVVPGMSVIGSDGAALGTVDSVHADAAGGQMIHVRAADGTLKAVPVTGATVRDGAVAVAWTSAKFEAAATAPAAMDPATPMPAPAAPMPSSSAPSSTPPTLPPEPEMPMTPPSQPQS